MQRTVKAHIEDLEQSLHPSNDELMQEDDLHHRNALESRIRAANEALEHYRLALVLEEKLRHRA